MKLLVEFSHPAQVHKFKYSLRNLQKKGHEILILSRDKDVMLQLLNHLDLPHVCISSARSGMWGMASELLVRELRTLYHALRFRPDVMLSAHSIAITHVGWLLRTPRLVHEDTEFGTTQQHLYIPFATRIITSTAYYKDWGPRQYRIPSLEPLSYLHPNWFHPDRDRLKRIGLDDDTPFAVLRLITWNAFHDRGLEGMTQADVEQTVGALQEMGYQKVVISNEGNCHLNLPDCIEGTPPEDLHHLLAFAELCLSESISVAGEAAVLGTPSLLINPLRAGHTIELENYGLLERVADIPQALSRAAELSKDTATQDNWNEARARLLENKSDMSAEFEAILEQWLLKG